MTPGAAGAPPSSALPRFFTDADGDRRILHRVPAISPFPHLFCPDGHPIRRTSFALQEDTFRCEAKIGASVCGLYLYVIADFHAAGGERLLLALEVTSDEIKRMRKLTITQKLAYLKVMTGDPSSRN